MSETRSCRLVLFGVNPSILRQLACRLAAILAVRCCQPDTDSAFINIEPQAALAIVLRKLAQLRVFLCKTPHTLL